MDGNEEGSTHEKSFYRIAADSQKTLFSHPSERLLLFTFISLSLSNLTPAPDTLIYVIGFYRHGIRNPIKFHPGDPNKENYQALGRPGDLTAVGKRQMYFVGQSLRERYGSFVDGYHKTKVTLSSTSSSRTIMSALSVMAGMFPPSVPIFRDLLWNPIPVSQDIHDMDKSYVLNLVTNPKALHASCPRYADMMKRPLAIALRPDVRPENKPLYEYMQRHTQDQKIVMAQQLYGFYDSFYFAQRNGLPLPSWATERRKEFQDKALYPDAMSSFTREYMETVMYFEKDKDMLDLFAGPMLYHVSSSFLRKVAYPNWPSRMHFHSTHDTAIYPVLRALEVDEPLVPEPGDGLIFELHQVGAEKFVKIFFHSVSTNTLKALNSPVCPNPCPLRKFTSRLKGSSPQQWKLNCAF